MNSEPFDYPDEETASQENTQPTQFCHIIHFSETRDVPLEWGGYNGFAASGIIYQRDTDGSLSTQGESVTMLIPDSERTSINHFIDHNQPAIVLRENAANSPPTVLPYDGQQYDKIQAELNAHQAQSTSTSCRSDRNPNEQDNAANETYQRPPDPRPSETRRSSSPSRND